MRVADDLVRRDFRPAGPNVLWVADITYLRSWEGWVYLAAVQDAFSRRIVGWAMAEHMKAELVTDALQMALARRRPEAGLIHHSDQGSQYVSLAFGQKARDAGIAVSMGSRGDCFDNAVAESFFATLKKELIRRRSWPNRRELQSAVFDYIESFYNRERRHSTAPFAAAPGGNEISVGWLGLGPRVACRWPVPSWARSDCGVVAPKPGRSDRATWRASSRRSRGSRGPSDDVQDPCASRSGSKPQMLAIRLSRLAGQLLVGRQYRAQRVEGVLLRLLAGAALAHRAGDLEHARDDPALLVGTLEGNREIDRCGHVGTVARAAIGAGNFVPKFVPDSTELD